MDERAERLRRRRKQSSSKRNEQAASDETSDMAESSKPSKPSNLSGDEGASTQNGGRREDRSIPVKEQQTGTYMYLPETQVRHLRRRYNVLKAEYEFEYNEEFEKNRHFYPLVVQYGLVRLDEWDASEVRSRLEELYE